MSDSLFGHECFGCGRKIEDNERHIHMPFDDACVDQGLDPLGDEKLNELFKVPYCSKCIVEAEEGYVDESHEIEPDGSSVSDDELRAWLEPQ